MSRLPAPFGPFEPTRRLGAGGMAETFEAVRRGPGTFEQRVCIKRILPAFETDLEFVAAFLREATTSAQLRHTNIVQVLDFGLADGSHYLALELIDGIDLRDLSARVGALPADLVTLIAIEVAAALQHAHVGDGTRPSVVHRDISPSNVLVSRAGEVKLVDFGIAKALGGNSLTATGVIKGKVPYLPPEYIEHAVFDPRSDLFSLGVMLYELASGQRPFDGETDYDTIRRIVAGQHAPLAALCPAVPDSLATCIERLIEPDPARRFACASDLLEALPVISVPFARRRLSEQLSELLPSPAPTASVRPDTGPPPPQASSVSAGQRPQDGAAPTPTTVIPLAGEAQRAGPSRRAVQVLAAAILCLGLTAVAAWIVRSPRQPQNAAAVAPPLPQRPVRPARPAVDPGATMPATPPPATPPPATPPPPSTGPEIVDTGLARTSEPVPHRATRSAELRVVAVPFGDVWIDGRPMGHAPTVTRLSPGSHEVAVGDGRPAQRRTLQLAAGETQRVTFRVEAK